MAVGSTNRARFTIVRQSSLGTPVAPTKILSCTGGLQMKPVTEYTKSQILRSDYQVADRVLTHGEAGGSVAFELMFPPTDSGLEDLIRAALTSGTVTAAISQVTGATCAGGDKVITKSSAFGSVEVGDIVKVSSATAPANDGYYRVTAQSANAITVERSSNLSSASDVVVDRGRRIKNGTTVDYLTMEDGRLDLDLYTRYADTIVDGMSLGYEDRALVGGSFRFKGTTPAMNTSTYTSGASADAVHPVLSSKVNLPVVRIDATDFESIAWSMDLNRSGQVATRAGTMTAEDVVPGEIEITGSLRAYFSEVTQFNRVIAATTVGILIVFQDSNGKAIAVSLPAVKLTDIDATAPGSNQLQLQTLAWAAFRHSTYGETIRIVTFA